jgi:hypothetical protein
MTEAVKELEVTRQNVLALVIALPDDAVQPCQLASV